MTHYMAVYYNGPKAKPSRVEVKTAHTKKGEEFIISAMAGKRLNKYIGEEFQLWLNTLQEQGITWKLLRSRE